MLKPFSGEKNLCPVEMGPKNGGFWRKWGSKLKILVSRRPKGTSFTGRMPFLPPNQQRQSTEDKLNEVSAAYFPFSKTFVCCFAETMSTGNDVDRLREYSLKLAHSLYFEK